MTDKRQWACEVEVTGHGLLERHDELTRISVFLGDVREGCGGRLIRGELGVGKSSFMAATVELVLSSGIQALQASGWKFETDVRYSCLNQLVLPVHAALDRLTTGPREALSVAPGFEAGAAPDVLLVRDAALLVTELADIPVVLVVDDAHWVDRGSAVVLGFIVRRLKGRRAGLLVSTRTGSVSFLDSWELPEFGSTRGIPSRAIDARPARGARPGPRLRRHRLLGHARLPVTGPPLATWVRQCATTTPPNRHMPTWRSLRAWKTGRRPASPGLRPIRSRPPLHPQQTAPCSVSLLSPRAISWAAASPNTQATTVFAK